MHVSASSHGCRKISECVCTHRAYTIAYACSYEGCGRKFKTPGALHTHTGWHKRRDNMDNGIYERQCHTQEVHLPPAQTRNAFSFVD